ncbi:MAG: valine--tRNA ligase [Nitrospiraceae bacterium]|nr:valine--tRNA ligase [Nitrospiraceae bacterium]
MNNETEVTNLRESNENTERNKQSQTVELPKFVPEGYEKKWQEFWEDHEIYHFDFNSEKPVFSIDTPPPTVSGKIHIGHAMAYSQTDFVARYKRMNGYNVFYPFGFDDNGLATERFVEKKNKVRAKSLKRTEFTQLCLETTKEVEKELKAIAKSFGISPDWNLYYSTINEKFRKLSQLSFIELYEKGREYRKEAPVLWCPHCQTAIAQVEMEDKVVPTLFNNIIFKVDGMDDLIISTTRPELLPACVSIFVHPNDKRYKGYIGKEATVPLFNYKVKIMSDSKVDPTKGSGVVMCCTFGDQTDMEWYQKYNLDLREGILSNGRMSNICGPYAGMTTKEAREAVINDLKEKGILVSQKKIMHSIHVHERCGHEIEIINTKQWFVKYLDLKDKFFELGAQLKWHPEFMKHRYDNWVKGLSWDWCISRQRFFGVPFPVWYCKNCGKPILAKKDQLPVDPLVDKPPVDKCPYCGSTEFVPEKDVMDTWATSSLTPLIMSGWQQNEEAFKKLFPMSLRPNGHDIISFWLFNSIVKSYLHTGKLPWKEAMINGFVLDSHGEKMSKSKGNISDPKDIIKQYSADILRYWAVSNKFGDDLSLNEKEFKRGRKFINKLWNASRFALSFMKEYRKSDFDFNELSTLNKWILSSLNLVIKDATEHMENYEFSKAKASIESFFWHDFCDNYLEIVKGILYSKENHEEKEIEGTYYTLYLVTYTILKLFAPFVPHITEEIYQLFFRLYEDKESIHLQQWPKYDEKTYDLESLNKGDIAIEVIGLIRKYKANNHFSMKEPIKRVTIYTKDKNYINYLREGLLNEVLATTHVAEINFDEASIDTIKESLAKKSQPESEQTEPKDINQASSEIIESDTYDLGILVEK